MGFQGGLPIPSRKKVMANLRYLYGADSGTCDQKKMARASPGGDEAMPRAPSCIHKAGALVGKRKEVYIYRNRRAQHTA